MEYEYINENAPSVKNNDYDYSNIIATVDNIMYLVKYCNDEYNRFVNLIEEDERRNEKFKPEFKEYNYKKSYSERFDIRVIGKNYDSITCKNLESFQSAVNNGNLANVTALEIRMDLDYKRGKGSNLIDHENSFTITFNPYKIIFNRKSSHNEEKMNQIEEEIKRILDNFQAINTIFCTK